MESRSDPYWARKRPAMSRIESADALLGLGTNAARLAIMLVVLGITVWEAFGH
ncbi:hypothetical protein EDF20_1925 [Frigoribacterium sp. PhB116]|nr:hypothetical protein EDF20_1925 [Frigoribacterium sp. PhB116]